MFADDRRIRHPGFLIVACFAVLILLGTGLLSLPVSHSKPGVAASLSEAFFTAVSAVTVTGLVVVDTGSTWSSFGEVIILILVQVGGLGIMTLAGFFGIVFTRRIGLRGRMLAGTEIGFTDLGALRSLIRNLVVFVLVSELVIAVLLTGRFLLDGDNGALRSVYLGVFHSVSAFNNAGFSILDGGLERYLGDWFMSLVIAGAFIIGGLGFPVVFELLDRWRFPRQWSLHTKVTISASIGLLAVGTVGLAVGEWTNQSTIGPASGPDKVLAAFFQSATARTAGFNTVPIQDLRSPSLLVLLLLMVVGASSASTGGGIKTSTFAVVIRATIGELRGDPETTMFARRIPAALERQALALVIAALGAIGTAAFALSLFQPDLSAIELVFEAASAFGTVGLSTGLTGELDELSRMVIVVLMFVGRVGPITFGTAVLLRSQSKRYGFASEGLIVG